MVKNVTGGNKSKGFARKSFAKTNHGVRFSQDEAEIYAQVTKIFGGPNCRVINLNGTELTCHIRGIFRGRGKRDNFITVGSWLLVGLREWEKETPGKLLNCDVIEVYNDIDKNKLKHHVTTVDWSLFISNDNQTSNVVESPALNNFEFTDKNTQEYHELIEAQIEATQNGKKLVISHDDDEDEEEINVDDI
jgi:translation initiation factor IF-1